MNVSDHRGMENKLNEPSYYSVRYFSRYGIENNPCRGFSQTP